MAGIALAFVTAGCSSSSAPRDPTTVTISQGSDILTFDPYAQLESPTVNIQRNVFDPLTDYDAHIKLQACLATEWKNVSPTEWIFTLRAGVKFQNGEAFGADDAVYSIRRALDWSRSDFKAEIPTIAKVEAVDDLHLRVTTSAPDAILPLRLTSILMLDRATCEPMQRKLGEDAFSEWLATHPNGTGPFRLESWSRDDRCVLIRNEQFWGPRPQLRRMVFIAASNDASRMVAFDRGEFDIMENVPPRYTGLVERRGDYRLIRQPGLRLIYLGLDVGRDKTPGIAASPPNPLRDLRVRQAIAMSLNNALIDRTIMNGNAVPAGQLFPDGVTGYDPALKPIEYNPDEARRLLAAAGYAGGFAVRLDGPNDRYVNDARILGTVAQQLARVGITVVVNARPKAQFFDEELHGHCSFFLIGWSNTNGDGIGTFDHLLRTPDETRGLGTDNLCTNYSNPEVDRLCDEASGEFDPAKRAALLQEAGRRAMHDLPHIPLHFQTDIYAVSRRIQWTPRRDTQVRGADVTVIVPKEGPPNHG